MVTIRPATLDDIPTLEPLIVRAVMVLQAADYTREQREAALGTVFGIDRQLIQDGTYLVAQMATAQVGTTPIGTTQAGSAIAGCGGWSRRRTLFGSDRVTGKDDTALDPVRDAARIRAFFVDPPWARRGVGAAILAACESAARAHGFTRFELMATLTGVPLYRAHGYQPAEQSTVPLPGGGSLPVVRMTKSAGAALATGRP